MKIRLHSSFSSANEDPEKLLLPGIIFINLSDPHLENSGDDIKGCMLCFGWWHWSLNLSIAFYR